MASRDDLIRLQRAQAAAVLCGDPAPLRDIAGRLPEELARVCVQVDPLGLRVAHLLADKLRFERLVQGLPGGVARFEADPAGFVDTFRAYVRAVPPTALEPRAEARAFQAWCRTQRAARPS